MEAGENITKRDDSENIGIEDLKKVTCLQHLSDEELTNVANVIIKFTEIVYHVCRLNAEGAALSPVVKISMNNSKSKAA